MDVERIVAGLPSKWFPWFFVALAMMCIVLNLPPLAAYIAILSGLITHAHYDLALRIELARFECALRIERARLNEGQG
jgi:hypothetical protein